MGLAPAVDYASVKRPNPTNEKKEETSNGLYIPIEVFGIITEVLIDTGSSISVLEPKLFDKIPDSVWLIVSPSTCSLRMANGEMSLPKGF